MIHHTSGDLFKSKAECLVNAVNCVGVSGKGIALAFKRRFPQNQAAYEAECEAGGLMVGQVFTFHEGNFWIANFSSKFHWRDKSHLPDIKKGLAALSSWVDRANVRSIAIPALGCGLGGLDWDAVLPEIESAFESSAADVFIYAPL